MLEIDPLLLGITVVVFLSLIFILNQILYKPLLKFIDDRNAAIKKDEESASANASVAGASKANIEKIILEARAAAAAVKQAAINKAKEEAGAKIAAKKAEIESEYAAFLAGLAARKEDLKNNLLAKLPELKAGLGVKLSQI